MSVLRKITYKKIAIFMLVLFMISLLPILYCSFFDYATGDDLWEGAAAYRVLVNHGSVKDFFRAVFEWAKVDYFGWEGNWSSIILWCLEPSIWGEKVYCITPWMALIALCGGTTYFLFYYLKKYLTDKPAFRLMVSVIVCFFSVQYMPYIRSGIFWYTGMINYIVPYSLCLVSFVWIDKLLETEKRRYCVGVSFILTYLSGAGYTPIVLAFEVLSLIILNQIVRSKRQGLKLSRGSRWLFFPLVLLITGFIFSAISPGNAARGGESYYFSGIRVVLTILTCIKQGIYGGIGWVLSVRLLLLIVPVLVIGTLEQVDVTKSKLEFNHPIFVTGLLFLISCSMYAPGIYAQSEVSGGVPDSIYFVFLLASVLAVIYLTCCVKKKTLKRKSKVIEENPMGKIRLFIFAGEIIFCIIFGKHLIGNMAAYICLDYIRSGQLMDFEYQMKERLAILHDPEIVDAVLPEMNNEQGPFMHMALLADPNAYTNMATARFYGKTSVIAIPRVEYYELYGYPEE